MSGSKPRSLYIDNLRIFLIILVVLHHLTITYAGIGDWYYVENRAEGMLMFPFLLFLFSNQSFFMGLFFLISAYFTVPSYNRKGGNKFLKDRLIRLGIPLAVFYFLINPITVYILVRYQNNSDLSFLEFYLQDHGFGFGPMWFVETLLYFTLIYFGVRYLKRKKGSDQPVDKPFPKAWKVIVFSVLIGLVSFVSRIWFSLGYSIPHTGLQVPYFTQYIAMLILGVYVYKFQWFNKISFRTGIKWFLMAQALIFIVFPAFFFLGGAPEGNLDPYTGGFHWESLFLSVLEQLVGISLMIGLIGIFKAKMNHQGTFKKILSTSAYTVYIIHPLVLVAITIGIRSLQISPYLKLLLLAPVVVFACFLVAFLIRKIPFFNRIL